MQVISKIKVISVAKVTGLLTALIYLIVGVVVNLISFGFLIPIQWDFLGLGAGILASFLAALLAGILTFAFGGLMAFAYNLISRYIGGIELELTETQDRKSGSSFAFLNKSQD